MATSEQTTVKQTAPKKLTPNALLKESKKLASMTEHTIEVNGQSFKFKTVDHFRKSKQAELLMDYFKFLDQAHLEQNGHLVDMLSPYATLLIFKHFTDIDVPDEIEEGLLVLEALIDLELIPVIMNRLPEAEVLKIYEVIGNAFENITNNINTVMDEVEALAETVENDELRDYILQKGRTQELHQILEEPDTDGAE